MPRNTRLQARNILCFLSACVAGLAFAGPAQAADSCPNAAFRTGASSGLPDCRAYEQVSPVDKGGTNVVSGGSVTEVAPGRVYFNTSGSLSNSNTVTFLTSFLATRGADWATQGLDPPTSSTGTLISKITLGISDDATKAAVVTTRAFTPGAIEGGSNIYIHNLTNDSYQLVAATARTTLIGTLSQIFGTQNYLGGTADLSSIAFLSPAPLTPGAPDDGDRYAYLWHDGRLELASDGPNGGPPVPASTPYKDTPPRSAPLLSSDGTRLTYLAGTNRPTPVTTAIYQYVSGQGTTLVSRSERGVDSKTEPLAAPRPLTSADGKTIYFTTDRELTDQPHPSHFYRWSAASDTRTPVAPDAKDVFAVSPDGRYVYYAGTDSSASDGGVWVYDTQDDAERRIANTGPRESSGPSFARLSPDGHRLLFRSFSRVTGLDNENPVCVDGTGFRTGFCGNLFTYDSDTPGESVVCVSCTDGKDFGEAEVQEGDTAFDGRDSRAITDDGRVFFHTPGQLVAEDTDTAADVYEYRPGLGARLLSRASTADRATFQEASPDTSNVYLVTTDRLVPQDTDSLADLYTARVNGGIASQQVAPAAAGAGCFGAACRPSPPAASSGATPGSFDFRPLPAKAAAPRFSVGSISASALRATARSGRLTVPVKVNTAGRLAATLRGRLGGRTIRTAASAAGRASNTGTVRLTLRLSKAARAALRRDGSLRLTLTVRFSEVDKASSRTLTLRTASKAKGGAR